MLVIFLHSLLLALNLIVLFRYARGITRVIPLSATILSLIAIFGPIIWEWSRLGVGNALLGFWSLSPEEVTQFRLVMLPYISGVSLGNAYVINSRNDRRSFAQQVSNLDRSKLILFEYFWLIIYLLGQGPNLFYRDSYLAASGFGTAERIAAALTLPVLAISLYLISTFKTRKDLLSAFSFHMIFTICSMGTGTRTSAIAATGLLVALAGRSRGRHLKQVALYILAPLVALLTFAISQAARGQPLGIFRIPSLIGAEFQLISADSMQYLILNIKTIISSLLTCVPIVTASSGYGNLEGLLQNFNPAVGSGLNASIYSPDFPERLYPFVWVPLATAGQLYAGLGPTGVVIFVGIISLMAGRIITRSINSSVEGLIALLTSGAFIGLMLLGIQYSSRMWLRVSWIIILFSIISFFIAAMKKLNIIRGSRFGKELNPGMLKA